MRTAPRSLRALADAGLRGVGQVLFQDSPVSGLLFLAGLAVVSPLYALAALLGSLIGSVFAGVLRADRSLLQTGMFGFNGALTALALLFFLKPTVLTWLCVVLAATCSSVLLLGCMTWLERWKLPALTAPFVLITFCVFLASAGFGRLETTSLMPTASLPKAATVQGIVTVDSLLHGTLNGLAQIFFQSHWLSALLFAAALLVRSPAACLIALAGSLTGALVAWGMGAAEPSIRAGLFGFNSALVAVALACVFHPCNRRTLAWALLAAAITPFVHAALSATLALLGLPALTLPFVLVTWVFLLAGTRLPALSDMKPNQKQGMPHP